MIQVGLAAGFLKKPEDFTGDILQSAADFLTLGSITELQREGNPEPREAEHPDGGYINAIDLENPGIEAACDFIPELSSRLREAGKYLHVSIAPTRPGGLGEMLERLAPHKKCARLCKINAACPNLFERGKLQDVLAHDPDTLESLLEETRGTPLPIALKIAPKTSIEMLCTIYKLCVEYEICAIVSANTLKIKVPVVDGKPLLHSSITHCGLSGEPLLEDNLKQIKELKKLFDTSSKKVPIIASGGILNGKALKESESAGAWLAQIGTGFARSGPRIFSDVLVQYVEHYEL